MTDLSTTTALAAGFQSFVYDDARGLLYLAGSDGNLYRWDPVAQTFLTPVKLGGQLSGLALTPDGRELLVGHADTTGSGGTTTDTIDRIDLATLKVDHLTFAAAGGGAPEKGLADLAIDANGLAIATTSPNGSGTTPIHAFSATTPTGSFSGGGALGSIGQAFGGSWVIQSENQRYVLLDGWGESPTPLSLWDARSGAIVATGSGSGAIVSGDVSDSGMVVAAGLGGLAIYDSHFTLLHTLSVSNYATIGGAHFLAGGKDLAVWNTQADKLLIYDTASWAKVGELAVGDDRPPPYSDKPIVLSADGRLLFLHTTSGFETVDLGTTFAHEPTSEVISGFTPGQSVLDLRAAAGLTSFRQVMDAAYQDGSDTVIQLYGGASIRLLGVTRASLTVHDIQVQGPAPVAGDINADGMSDVVIRGPDGSVAYLHSEQPNETFSTTGLGAQSPGYKLLLGGTPQDFDGDGLPDLLFRGPNGALQLWASNNGGGYVTRSLGQVASGWRVAGAGDFDGDGRSDLLWRTDAGDLQLWLHPGTGSSTHVDLGVLASSIHVQAVADFNGDGKADLLMRTDAGDTQLWLSGWTPYVFAKTDLGVVAANQHVIGAADFNGDGKADILWQSDSGDVSLWQSTGAAGAFTHHDQHNLFNPGVLQQIGDFNGDGHPDLLWRSGQSLFVWQGLAAGGGFNTFSLGDGLQATSQIRPGGVQAVDFTGDGDADILGYKADGSLQEWSSTGNGQLVPGWQSSLPAGAQLLLTGLRFQDFDEDGKADYLIKLANGHLDLRLSGSSVSDLDLGALPAGFTVVAAGDFNGDGKADLLLRNAATGVDRLMLSSGAGRTVGFAGTNLDVTGSSWSVVGVGDFNGDGKADILWRSTAGQLSLAASTTSALGFTHQDLGSSMGIAWKVLATADFNGDGELDILWRNSSTNAVQMWTSNPDAGTFSHVSLGTVAAGMTFVQADDFTGDGRADILWRDGAGHLGTWVSLPGQNPFAHVAVQNTISTDWHLT